MGSQVLTPKSHGLIHAIATVESMKVGVITSLGFQVLCPHYDMDAYITTLFGGET